ncbi:MAG: 3-deoxy-D-manno-octulosonic acid transferase [Armatimonadota bacterium]
MILALYNLLLLVASPVLLVWLLIRLGAGKGRIGWSARLGLLPKNTDTSRPLIWIHAVSVGEVIAAQPLLQVIRKEMPQAWLMMTCITDTGYETAQAHVGKSIDVVTQLPIDLLPCVALAMSRVKPKAFVCMETEIWPNLIACARRRGIPVMIANGRISDKSFPKYMKARLLIADTLRRVNIICTQSQRDADRFKAIGAIAECVVVTGNTKFDGAAGIPDVDKVLFRRELGLPDAGAVLVIGSTRAAEEELIVADAYTQLLKLHPDLCLVWAPRHLERKGDVVLALTNQGCSPWLRSDGTPSQPTQQIVLDTFGELAKVYALGEVAVIGGSFVPLGGQNLLQALAYGLPVVHGPYMQNFRDISAICMERGLSFVAKDANELAATLHRILSDAELRDAVRVTSQKVIAENSGASQRMFDALHAMMSTHR